MPRAARFTRRAYFVEPTAVRRARQALGAKTDAEAIRQSVELVAEMDAFRKFMDKHRGRLEPGSFDHAD
jgi:hypothetical protein